MSEKYIDTDASAFVLGPTPTDPEVLALAMLEAAEQAGSPEEARAAVARIAALAGPKPKSAPPGGGGTKPFRG